MIEKVWKIRVRNEFIDASVVYKQTKMIKITFGAVSMVKYAARGNLERNRKLSVVKWPTIFIFLSRFVNAMHVI